MRDARAVILGLWLVVAGSAQSLPEEVTLTVRSFPPSQVYLDTARGPTYLGKSGQPMRVKPPTMLDGQGRPAQYVNGYLILKANHHGEFRLTVPTQDWQKQQLPPEGGSYRLTANSPWVMVVDYLREYPLGSAALLGLLGAALVSARRWRRQARSRKLENQRLTSQLKTTGDPLLGKSLGGYRVEARLGQGGMGSVYRVRDESGGEFAAKVLYFDTLEAQELGRFRREFRVLSQLQHPSLVRAFDYGEEEGMAYGVMELLRGRTLDCYVLLGGQPWSTIWPWVKGVLEGLSCAHGHGVVHRDLKPSNIMVLDKAVKILDFGLARQAQITAVTLTGQAFGTPYYMAPEQISASGSEVDTRSDIYSLGIILFELLTGDRPFQSEDIQEIITQHITKIPPPVSSLVSGIPAGLDEVIATMLAKKPANRYPSVDRLLQVLAGFASATTQEHEPASAKAGVTSPDTLPLARRPRKEDP